MKSLIRLKGRPVNDMKGSIEGLPLQLMILMVVAGLSTTVIMAWMSAVDMPQGIGSVDTDPSEIFLSGTGQIRSAEGVSLNVTVRDLMGKPLEGAAVVLKGCGIENNGKVYALTGSDGVARFTDLTLSIQTDMDFVEVIVSKSGYGTDSSTRVLVL
ncbi:MAG TPA: carboxypeptidase regulatory-like domain-containing protein [Candidatus Methanomethylophilaceae archaeon]|nr:carboxypeptidase regulatory-like domain-containing protein [Candidatus Methanomethylophilaceae archaeon]